MGALYLPILEVLFMFLEDSMILRKDLLSKSYHPLAYFVAKVVSRALALELLKDLLNAIITQISVAPVLVILLLLMSVSTYTLAFYKSGSVQQFLALVSAQFIVGNVFASLGVCIAAWVKNPAYLMTTTMVSVADSMKKKTLNTKKKIMHTLKIAIKKSNFAQIVLVWLFTFAGFFVPTASIVVGLQWMVLVNPAVRLTLSFLCIILTHTYVT